MSRGLNATFGYLAKTKNKKAVEVLRAGLNCQHRPSRTRCVQSLLDRLEPEGHAEVFRLLPTMDEKCHSVVRERCKRLVDIVSETLLKGDHKEAAKACAAVLKFRLYDVLPALLKAAEKEDCPETYLAAQTTLKLAKLFYGELSGADGQPQRNDIENVRRRMTSALEEAARKYYRHQHIEIVEAYLLIAKSSNVTLRNLLRSPEEAAYRAVIEVLEKSSHGGVIRLLLGFLDDPQMPRQAMRILCGRSDPKFVKNLLRRACSEQVRPKAYAETINRFNSIAWAEPQHKTLESLDGNHQSLAVVLLMGTSVDREKILDVLEYLLAEGKDEGRRAAAAAIADFSGPRADKITVKSLNDSDAEVRAHLLKQLRPRKIPGAMTFLIRMADEAPEPVRKALHEALPEFSFRQFMMNFDSLPEDLQEFSGHLVCQIDTDTPELLSAELEVLSPVRRRRAVNAALIMGLVREMEEKVVALLSDPDHMVRVAAAQALSQCETVESWDSLREALLDRSVVVQEAAEQSLQKISQSLMKCPEEEEAEPLEEELSVRETS